MTATSPVQGHFSGLRYSASERGGERSRWRRLAGVSGYQPRSSLYARYSVFLTSPGLGTSYFWCPQLLTCLSHSLNPMKQVSLILQLENQSTEKFWNLLMLTCSSLQSTFVHVNFTLSCPMSRNYHFCVNFGQPFSHLLDMHSTEGNTKMRKPGSNRRQS